MNGQNLIIVFREDKAYLTADKAFSFEQLGFLGTDKSCKEPAYWHIKVINYIEEEAKIFCEILSYHIGEARFSVDQQLLAAKLNSLQVIKFKSIKTDGLLMTLHGNGRPYKPVTSETSRYDRTLNSEFSRKPFTVTIKESFFVALKKVQFRTGYVSFFKKFKQHKDALEITIRNEILLEEFEAVKNYFANALNTKRIEVSINIVIQDNIVSSIEAHSPEIKRIDNELIQNVKFNLFKSRIKDKSQHSTKEGLLTKETFLEQVAENDLDINSLFNDDKELIDELLKVSNSKHFNHLQYLAGEHAYTIMNVRYVFKPMSFLFLLEGEIYYHFIWETLNTSEATYVWRTSKNIADIKSMIGKIEQIINQIKTEGKSSYLKSPDEAFGRIFHDYAESEVGFKNWKAELKSILS